MADGSVEDQTFSFLRQMQFFLIEAGFIGVAILALRRSTDVMIALLFLAVLPFVSLGGGNDLVMRASIPSLAVLAIAACRALAEPTAVGNGLRKKAVLTGLLLIGAITPIAEIARAILLPVWPINAQATLIGVNCGTYPPHYVARLGGGLLGRIMRSPNPIALGPQGPASCFNPALALMWGEARRPNRQPPKARQSD